MNAPIALDRLRQVAPQLYELLRDRIVSLSLPPGTALARTELAAQFGVSQTPVRDALMRLQEEGLVDVFPQAATRVSKIDMTKAVQAHFLRRAIELEIVRDLAAPENAVTADLIVRLRRILEDQTRLAAAADYLAFSDADHAFHRELYRAAGMGELLQLLQSRSGHIERLRRLHLPTPGKMQQVIDDHLRIVEAIAARQTDVAQASLRAHLSGTLSQVDEIRARHPDYF
ncbi:GntR family transcriptional regulator [Schauerella aestuarii]|uniref:GntR family transcriptional regulator n=1 Tax=Schauerella aestuarii TaxID=2511204 RepID=UPI001368F2CC|nr:GntR family transcriptional regulator [Achromobacter aestuarii]MYZ44351.1 GntR family transcriptional regulator [Achromobacter aestuarii]